ncbi:MAG: DUF3793 family protein [Treponema sp.]|jgi:hypothetical protein|nr:DUF3793 family protein [Treponema sp.]
MEISSGGASVQERFLNKCMLANIYQLMLRLRGERNRLEVFIRWAAGPAIGGIKPASLVRLPRNGMDRAWDTWGKEICRTLDISAAHLRESSSGVLALLYRRCLLRRALKGPPGRYLRSLSYSVGAGLDSCLEHLANRFSDPDQFPHEVGVFLGYPLEDVVDFSAGKPSPYNCRGYWKVYHRPEKAKRAFACMDRARLKMVGEFSRNFGGDSKILFPGIHISLSS